MDWIKVGEDNWNFCRDNGKTFIPFGTNYHDPDVDWPPRIWEQFDEERVKRHFDMMKELGTNVVRVLLAAKTLVPRPDYIEEKEVEKIDMLLDIAGSRDVYLIITGPDGWEGIPDYWKETKVSCETGDDTGQYTVDRFATEATLDSLEMLWEHLATRYSNNPTIMAWSLLNEPLVGWNSKSLMRKWNKWVKEKYGTTAALKSEWNGLKDGEKIKEIRIPENANSKSKRLWDYQLFREHIADEWTKRQVKAIRNVNTRHLITTGLIQWSFPLARAEWMPSHESLGWFYPIFPSAPKSPSWYAAFNPGRQKEWFDYISVHFYPDREDPFASNQSFKAGIAYMKAVVDYCYVGLPVVLEEFGWYGGGGGGNDGPYRSEEEQAMWNASVIEETLNLASGWVPWGFADCPHTEGLASLEGLFTFEGKRKEWANTYEKYCEVMSNMSKLERTTEQVYPDFDFREALTSSRPEEEIFEKYVRGESAEK